jgi:hypothetical protein
MVGVDDADDLVDFIIRHLGLAEAIDEGGTLKRIDVARRETAARLGFLDEARSSESAAALAVSRFRASRMTCFALGRI